MAELAISFASRAAISIASGFAVNAISSLFASDRVLGGELESLRVLQSLEGAAMPIVFGRVRTGGQVIWADKPVETREQVQSGGKGGPSTSERSYSTSFAVGLCEGVIDGVGRIWADGKLLDSSRIGFRLHNGEEDQLPDSLIQAAMGIDQTPAFKGLAYIVFEGFPLSEFGNRIPQLSFEVFRSPDNAGNSSGLRQRLQGVCLIPGSGEFAYATDPVLADLGPGVTRAENMNNSVGGADILVALDDLERVLPKCKTVSLVVSWFGSDLRCDRCEIRPCVENNDKVTIGQDWQVNGVSRYQAQRVSLIDGRPAFGGTPSDLSVLQTIAELKSRGFRIVFYPFILMDVPPENGLADPYGASEQAAFPWRGRITSNPAPGQSGSPDKSAAMQSQVDSFFGNASPADFVASAGSIAYSGAAEWSFRRMILHYAHLCQLAGGVDGFLVGSELPGLTTLRSSQDQYPSVLKLAELAADVRTILPQTSISYAADWSEYFGHHPKDGSSDVYFHLDSFWADPAVDFVGIDWYVPLSDWRSGEDHLDASIAKSIYDSDYLQSNMDAGEGYDWYYASIADRDAQIRTPIVDSAYNKDWVFRYKDLISWWSQSHFDRPGGVENQMPTAWVPSSKPIWFTEAGCPAVDVGSNQPNVFYDPKSSESFLPYYSNGRRDDLIQRKYCEAILERWQVTEPSNPTSSVYGGPMIDPADIMFWTWDARPFPDFPSRSDVWVDGENWKLGHWLNGRVGFSSLSEIITNLCESARITDFSMVAIEGVVTGFIVSGGTTVRQGLSSLAELFGFDVMERFGSLSFVAIGSEIESTGFGEQDLAAIGEQFSPKYLFEDAENLVTGVKVQFINDENDYQPAEAFIQIDGSSKKRLISLSMPLVSDQSTMRTLSSSILARNRQRSSELKIGLPPSSLRLEVGDVISFDPQFISGDWKITQIDEQNRRELSLVPAVSSSQLIVGGSSPGLLTGGGLSQPARPQFILLDIPLLPGESERIGPRVAASGVPWIGNVQVTVGAGSKVRALLRQSARIGSVINFIPGGGFTSRYDHAVQLQVNLPDDNLLSVSSLEMLSGANSLAVAHSDGSWEIIQFQNASLQVDGSWLLSTLLRGQSGSDVTMATSIDSGATIVLFDGSSVQLPLSEYELGVELTCFAKFEGQVVPANQQATAIATFTDQSRIPRMPVHLKVKASSENIVVSWIRRTRIGGDNWFSPDVPLAEGSEQYAFSIFVDDVQVLSEVVTQSSRVFSTGELAQLFYGVMPIELDVSVAQISTETGIGPANRQLLII